MKIIQHGNTKFQIPLIKRFKCSDCNCIFECDNENEYVEDSYIMINEIVYKYSADCPECGGFSGLIWIDKK